MVELGTAFLQSACVWQMKQFRGSSAVERPAVGKAMIWDYVVLRNVIRIEALKGNDTVLIAEVPYNGGTQAAQYHAAAAICNAHNEEIRRATEGSE
jgi:hypothetical protein